jgi:hypothetical protein
MAGCIYLHMQKEKKAYRMERSSSKEGIREGTVYKAGMGRM